MHLQKIILLCIPIAVFIFLILTLIIYRKKLHALEKFGWVSGIIAALVAIASSLVSNLQDYAIPIGVSAIFVLGFTGVVSLIERGEKKYDQPKSEPRDDMSTSSKAKGQYPNPESRVLKISERETEDSNLDPALYHLTAVLFYPEDTPKKYRVPSNFLPIRGIINWSTKKVYYMDKDTDDLLIKRSIKWNTRDWVSEEDFENHFKKLGLELFRRPANLLDLEKITSQEEKPERSVGLSIPFGEFTLFTDKPTYRVGDTIRAYVKVLSIILGTTIVRLISPTGEQHAIETTDSTFSKTFSFDLGVVEQSWEKGIWKVTAKRGSMYDEQEIEIL